MNQLSIHVSKLDFKHILNNCLDQTFWSKKWSILEYDNILIQASILQIRVDNDELVMKIARIRADDELMWERDYEALYLRMHPEHFNEKVFLNRLNRCIFTLLESHASSEIKGSPFYHKLAHLNAHLQRILDYRTRLTIPSLNQLRVRERKTLLINRTPNSSFKYNVLQNHRKHLYLHVYRQFLLLTGQDTEIISVDPRLTVSEIFKSYQSLRTKYRKHTAAPEDQRRPSRE